MILEEIVAECTRAEKRYGPFRSSHEGLGVLVEEVAELIAAVRSNKTESIRIEAIQVAAVATRIAEACRDDAFIARSVP